MPGSYAALVGDKPATLGPTLASFKFGEPVDPQKLPQATGTTFGFLGETAPSRFDRAARDPGPQVLVDLEIRAEKLFAFRIELYTDKGSIPEDHCDGFARSLDAKWGPSPERIWVDRQSHVRAALQNTCVLSFERYADPATWIGPEPTSIVPVALVGKSAKELASRVAPGTKLEEDITLRDLGVGEHASGATTIDVYMHKGKVMGLGVEAAAGEADRKAIRDRISAAWNAQPTRDATTGYDVWATTPPIRTLSTQAGVRVEVGKLP